MNKKVIIAICAVVVVVAIVAVILLLPKASNQGGAGNTDKSINLSELNTEISQKPPFDEMPTMDIDADVLTNQYEIGEDDYEEVIGKMPMMNIQASMYLVIKAKDGKVEDVKTKVDNYAQKQEEIWSTYLPEQYDIVKQRKSGVVGNYVYLVMAESADEIEKLIKK